MSVGTSTAKRTVTPPITSAVAGTAPTPPASTGAAQAPASAHGSQSAPTTYAKTAQNPYSTGTSTSRTAQSTDKSPASKPAPKADKKALEREWSMNHTKSSKVETSGGDAKTLEKLDKEVKGGKTIVDKKVSAEKQVGVKKEFNETLAKTGAGDLSHKGKVEVGAKATAQAGLKVTSKGVELNAEAKVEAKAGGEYNISFKSKEFTINGQKVRADFSLNLSAAAVAEAGGKVELAMAAGPPPKAIVKLGGKAFAGVQAGAELSGSLVWVKGKGEEVTLAKGTVGASVSAGIGASAGLQAGYADGKLSLEAYAGVTLGVGASVKMKGEIDLKAMGEFAKTVGEKGVKDLVGGLVSAKDIEAVATGLMKKWQELPGTIAKKVGSDAVTASKDMDQATKEAAAEVAKRAKEGKPVNVVQVTREKMEQSNNVIVKGAGGAVRVFEWLNGW